MKYPEFVKYKFHIYYSPYEKSYMYTELKDGRYAKTYNKNDKIMSEYISEEEYASALLHHIITQKSP